MVERDGGQVAAHGLQYQYLRTIEILLGLLESGADSCRVHVEGRDDLTDGAGSNQIVDIEVVDGTGRTVLIEQVKSVLDPASSRELTGPDIARILGAFMATKRSDTYRIVVNGRLNSVAGRLCDQLNAGTIPDDVADLVLQHTEHPVGQATPAQILDCRQRLRDVRVLRDPRSSREVRNELRERIRAVRLGRSTGAGIEGIGLLTGYLVSRILAGAAGLDSRRIDLAEFRRWIDVDPATLAGALGRYDWGIPIGALPRPKEIRRSAELARITEALTPAEARRSTGIVAVTGQSGIGKTCIVSQYIFDSADAYDYVVWIDAETDEGVARVMRRLRDELRPSPSGDGPDDVRDDLATAIARFPGRLLLVFDDVRRREWIDRWIPRLGDVDVIVTTTRAAGWLGLGETVVQVSALSRDDAIRLVARRLSLADLAHPELNDLHALVDELGRLPLALAMASNFLVAAGGQVPSVSVYRERLKRSSLTAPEWLDAGYTKTMTAAVLLAISEIADRASGSDAARGAMEVIVTCSYLATKVPLSLAVAAAMISPESLTASGLHGPLTQLDGPFTADEVVAQLRGQSLVDREIDGRRGEFFGDTISFNEMTQWVVRQKLESLSDRRPVFQRVDSCARHLSEWFSFVLNSDDLRNLTVWTPLAQVLVGHARRLGFADLRGHGVPVSNVATVMGNLGMAKLSEGAAADALGLADGELELLANVGAASSGLALQTHTLRLQALDRLDRPTGEVVQECLAVVGLVDASGGRARSALTDRPSTSIWSTA